jgi:hypothetical protein
LRLGGNFRRIAGGDTHDLQDPHVEALIRLQLACQLALEALPALRDETEQVLRNPVETLCDVTSQELDRINPGWRDLPVFS